MGLQGGFEVLTLTLSQTDSGLTGISKTRAAATYQAWCEVPPSSCLVLSSQSPSLQTRHGGLRVSEKQSKDSTQVLLTPELCSELLCCF